MRVVFLAPAYPPEMIQYTRGLAEVGAEVYGVGDTPREALPREVKPHLYDYLQVPRILDEDDVIERVSTWLEGTSIDRVLANWEVLVMLAARLRERWGMPGMSPDTVRGFRDKEIMKERVRAAGLRVPRSCRVRTEREVREAAEEIGFPLILKPIAGAGSADTYQVRTQAELEATIPKMRSVQEASCEEYIEGEEFTFDTVCIGGKPAYENIAQYLPKPIEARSLEWVSPVIITVRDMYQARLAAGHAAAQLEAHAALRRAPDRPPSGVGRGAPARLRSRDGDPHVRGMMPRPLRFKLSHLARPAGARRGARR